MKPFDVFSKLQYPQVKRLVVLVFGLTLFLIGILMIFLPGPALIVIPLSLAVLGTEFLWAKRILARFHHETRRFKSSLARFLCQKTKKN